MRRVGWLAVAATALLAAGAGAADLDVLLLSPPPGQPAFGKVEVAAEVLAGEAVDRVELWLDGAIEETLTRPPYRFTVDLGNDNRAHRFEVRAYGADGGVGEAVRETPAIPIDLQVDAQLQQLYVTALAGGSRVLDLEAGDFEILDEGARQELVTFARGDIRLTAALLVDASASMRGARLRSALTGAAAFVQAMKPEDDASLLVFSDRLLHSTPFSNDLATLTAGLAEVRADGGTALDDHLYLALKRLEHEQGRRVVVILSDGIDSHSVLEASEVRWLARRSRALIYWIRTDPRDMGIARFSAWKGPDDYREDYRQLTETVEESGGRIVTLERIEDAGAAFREILRELREQYVLGYYPTSARDDGSWHRVEVRARRPGVEIRTQAGYIDY